MPASIFSNHACGGRGATLIELAIALAVVGILMGGALVPLRALEERRQLEAEMRRLEATRDAIVGYALRHRTRERVVKFEDDLSDAEWSFRLPKGRPYLPCPDWDGDGFEDRVPEGAGGFMQGLEVNAGLTVTVTINIYKFWNFFRWGVSGDLRPYGECRAARGAAPWRTLGVEPSDGWGNRHTYFADPVFSNSLFGFDRQTIADVFDPRMPQAPGILPAQRLVDYDHFEKSNFSRRSAGCPTVICDGGRAGDCTTHGFTTANSGDEDQCRWKADLENLILKAGAATKEVISGRKSFRAGDVIDGLPFVLVSHGPNGRFAVNHWATLNKPADDFGNRGPVCNESAWATPALPDNSFARGNNVAPRGNRGLNQEAANASRPAPIREGGCTQVGGLDEAGDFSGFNPSFFVWNPPNMGNGDNFDDLLLWMTREELSVALPGNIPRLPPMIIAYFHEPRRR